MIEAPESLVRDFLEWLDRRPRTYSETLEVWRTSCPRLTVLEDALEAGLAARRASSGGATVIEATEEGRRWARATSDLAR